MKEIFLAVLTYNSFFSYAPGIRTIEKKKILILPRTFAGKRPEDVLPTDPNWMMLLKHKKTLKRIIIFAGKESSQALKIIELACREFSDKKDCLFFILCDHQEAKKVAILKKHGIPRSQYMCFKDGHLPCEEDALLIGYMYKFIRQK